MVYRGKKYKRIVINIKPEMEFKGILDTLEEISLPEVGTKPQNIKYAILEMVNNSIRAHRENNIAEPLSITFEYESPSLRVEVTDRGPGFNPEGLPYSLEDNPQQIDVKSAAFAKYREENNYQRFGMGLFVVKKTFQDFNILFLDHNGNIIPWAPGQVHGTTITVGIKRGSDGT